MVQDREFLKVRDLLRNVCRNDLLFYCLGVRELGCALRSPSLLCWLARRMEPAGVPNVSIGLEHLNL